MKKKKKIHLIKSTDKNEEKLDHEMFVCTSACTFVHALLAHIVVCVIFQPQDWPPASVLKPLSVSKPQKHPFQQTNISV